MLKVAGRFPAKATPTYTSHEGGGNGQPIGYTISDAIVRI